MKILLTISSLSALLFFLCACSSNPRATEIATTAYKDFLPGKLLLDNNSRHVNAHGAGFIYSGGKYYMFGEHKLSGRIGNKSLVGVHCYSSKDLYNWKDEGIALPMSRDPKSEMLVGAVVERPKVVYNAKTGKYVMWGHLEHRKGPKAKSLNPEDISREYPSYSTARTFVAVADKVTGPYKFIKSFRPNAKKYPLGEEKSLREARDRLLSENIKLEEASVKKLPPDNTFARDFEKGQMARDMTVFVDDDPEATAYLICASEDNATLHIHELTPDYLDFTGRFKRVFKGGFHEAPAVFKRGNLYYMFTSHCTGWRPNAGRSAVSNSMFGEWRELGNPFRGDGEKPTPFAQKSAPDTSFRSQSTYVIPVQGKKGAFIYVGDRWNPDDAMDGRYIFLPVEWEGDKPFIRWRNKWDLKVFDKTSN